MNGSDHELTSIGPCASRVCMCPKFRHGSQMSCSHRVTLLIHQQPSFLPFFPGASVLLERFEMYTTHDLPLWTPHVYFRCHGEPLHKLTGATKKFQRYNYTMHESFQVSKGHLQLHLITLPARVALRKTPWAKAACILLATRPNASVCSWHTPSCLLRQLLETRAMSACVCCLCPASDHPGSAQVQALWLLRGRHLDWRRRL